VRGLGLHLAAGVVGRGDAADPGEPAVGGAGGDRAGAIAVKSVAPPSVTSSWRMKSAQKKNSVGVAAASRRWLNSMGVILCG
jgi:hypothetical protein